MKFLNRIKNANDNQLERIVQEKIRVLERKNKKNNPKIRCIGCDIDFNFKHYPIEEKDGYEEHGVINCNFFNSFLDRETKLVYGIAHYPDGRMANIGRYYYMDDQSYLYDFCRFIKNQDVETEKEFLGYVSDFLFMRLGVIKRIERDQLFIPIIKSNDEFFEPVREHSIRSFYGTGSAMCSEFSAMAQNILRLFDIESYLIIGYAKLRNNPIDNHAYNLVVYSSDDGERKSAIVDFRNPIGVYDINMNRLSMEPFIGEISANGGQVNQDFINDLLFGDKKLIFDEYAYHIIGRTVLKTSFVATREYFANEQLCVKEMQKSLKKNNSVQ